MLNWIKNMVPSMIQVLNSRIVTKTNGNSNNQEIDIENRNTSILCEEKGFMNRERLTFFVLKPNFYGSFIRDFRGDFEAESNHF